MRWTERQLAEYEARRKAPRAQSQQAVRHEPVAEAQGKTGHAESIPRRLVRITSYRRRLLDFDNLAGGCKYFLDCCKYAKLVQDDAPDKIFLEVRQVKVINKAEERTEITVDDEPTKI